jgi:hypothetical protein
MLWFLPAVVAAAILSDRVNIRAKKGGPRGTQANSLDGADRAGNDGRREPNPDPEQDRRSGLSQPAATAAPSPAPPPPPQAEQDREPAPKPKPATNRGRGPRGNGGRFVSKSQS